MNNTILDKKTKDTDIITLGEMLSNDHVFRIPDYQRGYAWNKEFKDLWLDILRLYRTGMTDRKHYTGMVSLEEIKDENIKQIESIAGTTAFYIVDGQQRITSLVIILKTLIDYIADEDSSFEKILYNSMLQTEDKVYRFGYSYSRMDTAQQYFLERVFNNNDTLNHSDQYLSNINEAVEFMKKELNRYDIAQAKDLLDLTVNKMVFNIYFVTENFDVRVAFETMNNRGKKLSKLELLKNRLMYLSTCFPTKSNYGNMLKGTINNAWKDIYKNLSFGDFQLSDDDYLKAHWIVYKRLNKRKGDAYIVDLLDNEFAVDKGDFYNYISAKDYTRAYECLNTYVGSLSKYSAYWGYVNHPDESHLQVNPEEAYWTKRIGRVSDSMFVRSTIMVVLAENGITLTDKIDFYSYLEQFIFINKYIAQDTNDLSFLVTGAKDLLNAENKEKLQKLIAIKKQMYGHDLCVDKHRIEKALVSFKAYIDSRNSYYYSWSGLSYFLYEYDESLKITNASRVIWYQKNSVSIEHIFPQTPEKEYWKRAFYPYISNDENRNRITNALGNMLLLSSGSENSSLSNFSYPVKREMSVESKKFAYVDGSRSARKIAEDKYWTPKQIFERSKLLFDFMYEHWVQGRVVDFSKPEWDALVLANDLINFKYQAIPDEEYKCLIAELDSIDTTQERQQVSAVLHHQRRNNYLQNQVLEYIDREVIDIKYNTKKIFYKSCFTFKIIESEDSPIEFQCGVHDESFGDIRIRYFYSSNEMEAYSWTKSMFAQSIDMLDDRTKLFVRSFYRYVRKTFGKVNPSWCDRTDMIE